MFKKNSDQTGKQSFSTVFSFCSIFLPLDCRQNKAFAIQYWQKRALFVLKKKKTIYILGILLKQKLLKHMHQHVRLGTLWGRFTQGIQYSAYTYILCKVNPYFSWNFHLVHCKWYKFALQIMPSYTQGN